MRSVPLAVLACLLCGCAGEPPPPPHGLVPDDLAALPDPAAAILLRIDAMPPLLRAMDEGGEPAAEARPVLQRLAREVSLLCGREVFEGMPLLRAELRTIVLFVADEDRGTREEAWSRIARMRARIGG